MLLNNIWDSGSFIRQRMLISCCVVANGQMNRRTTIQRVVNSTAQHNHVLLVDKRQGKCCFWLCALI